MKKMTMQKLEELWEASKGPHNSGTITAEAWCILKHVPFLFDESDLTVAEIGVYRAETSVSFLETLDIKKYYAIDPWEYSKTNSESGTTVKHSVNDGSAKKEALERLDGYTQVQIIQKPSADAHSDIENDSLDFLFIDGDHDTQAVLDDIVNYLPKVKDGGIIAGDDYYWPTVTEAVDQYEKDTNVKMYHGCPYKKDSFRTWYFIKGNGNE